MDKAFVCFICILVLGAGLPHPLSGAESATDVDRAAGVVGSHPDEGQDDARVRLKEAQALLLRADDARQEQPTEAARLYEAALALYQGLARDYPDWQSGLVKFRQAYCEARVGDLSQLEQQDIGWHAGAWAIGPPAPLLSPPENDKDSSEAATDNNPGQAVALASFYNQAAALLDQRKAQEALQTLRQGLRLNADHKGLHYLVGLAQCQLGNFEDALYVLMPLVREHETFAYGHLALGTAYFGLNRIDAARLALEQALTLKADLHEAHFNLAQMLATIDPPDKNAARHHYREARRLGAKRDRVLESELR